MSLSTKRAWEIVRSAWAPSWFANTFRHAEFDRRDAERTGPLRVVAMCTASSARSMRGRCSAWKGPGDSSPQKTARAGATHRAGHGAEELRPPSDRTLPQCVTWFFSANGTYL